MALYRWNVKLAWIWAWFNPSSSWSTWQYLKRTSNWYDWDSVSEFEPSNTGSTDQVLTKTAGWYEWATLASWWLPVEFVEKLTLTGSSNDQQYIGKTYDYPVYVIATSWNTWFNEPQAFVVATWSSSSSNSYPSSWSYSQQYGIAHGYAYTGSKIYMVKNWWVQNMIYDIYIYKLNLPS